MSNVLFVEYPKCSTCRRAKAWLDAHGIAYTDRHIVEDNPTAEELAAYESEPIELAPWDPMGSLAR